MDVTPIKRTGAGLGAGLPTPDSKGKRRRAPAPNPPLAPFPTPPPSRTRTKRALPPSPSFLDADDRPRRLFVKEEEFKGEKSTLTTARPLPSHLQTLLSLHHAFNLALSLHIATSPPVLPPHPPTTTRLPLYDLTNLISIREAVERTSGKRFTSAELARLVWLWTWDGVSPSIVAPARNPFLDDHDHDVEGTVIALGYVVSITKTLDATGKKIHTYGLGIELDLRKGETRQILHNGAEGGLSNKGQGGGMGAVGRWSSAGEAREQIVRERLYKWAELNGGHEEIDTKTSAINQLPTPSTSSHSDGRSNIPPIPMAKLPKLPSALLPAVNLFPSPSSSGSASVNGISAFRPAPTTAGPAGLSDPFVMEDTTAAKSGSVEQRRQAMYARIKARSSKLPTLGSAIASSTLPIPRATSTLSSAMLADELKRRSTLSRLEGIAEGVWMMFSAPAMTGTSGLPSPGRGRRKAIPLDEVVDVVVESSKTPISSAEANASLKMLTDLCPFFLILRVINRQEWLEMPSANLSGAPASTPSTVFSAGVPLSPSPKSRARTDPQMLAIGPASPGKVRRHGHGGLREVRERIRRELGED